MADELLHSNRIDHEIWRADDGELWLVHRPRVLAIVGFTFWTFIAITAGVVAVGALVSVLLAGEGGGYFAWIATTTPLAGYALLRAVQARRADRAIRARPFRELEHVRIARPHLLVGHARIALADVRLEETVEDFGESDKHVLRLRWGDDHLRVTYGSETQVGEARRIIVAAGIR